MGVNVTQQSDTDHSHRDQTDQEKHTLATGKTARFLWFSGIVVYIAATAKIENEEKEQSENEPKARDGHNNAYKIKGAIKTSEL